MIKTSLTLIELMIVTLIVAVLAAILVPLMTARLEAARWSEGKAGAGTIATAIRAYAAKKGDDGNYPPSFAELGIDANDLKGEYFSPSSYTLKDVKYINREKPEVEFEIVVENPVLKPHRMTFDSKVGWIQTDSTIAKSSSDNNSLFISIILCIFAIISGFYVYQLHHVTAPITEMKKDIEQLLKNDNQINKYLSGMQKEINKVKEKFIGN